MKTLIKHPTLMSKKFYSMLLGGTLTMTVCSLLLMSDSIIAGIVIGSEAVAGVTLVTPMYSLAAFFGSVISLGVPILYSIEMGKFNKKRADQVFGLGILMSLIVGVLMFIIISLFGEVYLRSNTSSGAILEQAKGYLSWMRFTILIMPIQMLMGEAIYSDGDETISTVATGIQGLGNIIFSIVFSQFMGIAGIGLASFLFNALSLLLYLTHFLRKSNSLRINIYFSFSVLKDLLRYSIIDSSSYLFLSAFTAILNLFVSYKFGPQYLIIVSTIALCREFQLVFEGIGEAIAPILSVYAGEKSKQGMKYIFSIAKKTAIIEGIVVSIALFIFASFAPSILDVTQPEMIHFVKETVLVTALGSTFVSLMYLLTSYYLIIERIALGFVACAIRDVIFSISLIFVFGEIWSIFGLYLGLLAAPIIGYFTIILYIRKRYGKEDTPLLLDATFGSENSYLYNLTTESEDVMRTQHEVETLLREHNVDNRTVARVTLLIEEMYTFISEMNDNKPVLAECTVFFRPEGVQIVTKDGGIPFDMADEDLSTKSLSAYTVASYLEKRDFGNRHLTTMSFNRSSFLVKYDQ